MFQPISGGPAARSEIKPDGTFSLSADGKKGAVIGENRVRVTSFELQKPDATTTADEEPSLGGSAIPKKYNRFATSGIVIDVQPDLELPLVISLD